MPAALLALLKNPKFALALAGLLGGGLFKDRSSERRLREIMRLLSPGTLADNARQFETNIRGGAAFSQAQRDIAAAANAASSTAGQSIASRGLTGSGLGTLISSIGSNTAGFQMGKLNADVATTAHSQALDLARLLVGGIGTVPVEKDTGSKLFGDVLGSLALSLPRGNAQTRSRRPERLGTSEPVFEKDFLRYFRVLDGTI